MSKNPRRSCSSTHLKTPRERPSTPTHTSPPVNVRPSEYARADRTLQRAPRAVSKNRIGPVLLRRRPTCDRPKASTQGERPSEPPKISRWSCPSKPPTYARPSESGRALLRPPQNNFKHFAMVLSFYALENPRANFHPLPRMPPHRSTRVRGVPKWVAGAHANAANGAFGVAS